MRRLFGLATVIGLACCLTSRSTQADGPADNIPDKVRPVPPVGVEVPEVQRQELEKGLAKLKSAIDELAQRKDALTRELLPDVQIYHNAVSDTLTFGEFFKPPEIETAKSLLTDGLARADELKSGRTPWTTQMGAVPRGYVSKIDGSVQPYGLVMPESFTPAGPHRWRLDIWFHGRGETLSEVNFLDQRRKDKGQFSPPDTIVLHPYGRYCNANKLAGEIDTLEALESVKRRYRIDEDRIVVRGFSMGGAACWQFAVHYTDRWCAAAPGAGFSETPDFLTVFQKETLAPTWYEQKLWHLYDCTDYAANLAQLPTVAYSGEKDSQKQAADIMAAALQKEGIDLVHLIGPGTGHNYHPDAKIEIDRRINSIVAAGRDRVPYKLRFTTPTLRYNRMHWLTVDSLGEHWEKASVKASLYELPNDDTQIGLKVTNVTGLTLSFPSGWAPTEPTNPLMVVVIEGEHSQSIEVPKVRSDRSWYCPLHRKNNGEWKLGPAPADGLRKQHGLQGPIDDAFLDSFVFVRPTGTARHAAVEKWTRAELDHAIKHWRQQFRGHARVKDDNDITDADIAEHNLVLWGDPASNVLLKKIADKLPIQWTESNIVAGERRFPADKHALIAIFPNPLNPQRYVVLNSGFTFREYDYLNNARQVPKLPDWAIVDLTTPPNSRFPGKIADADFFDERWQLRPKHD